MLKQFCWVEKKSDYTQIYSKSLTAASKKLICPKTKITKIIEWITAFLCLIIPMMNFFSKINSSIGFFGFGTHSILNLRPLKWMLHVTFTFYLICWSSDIYFFWTFFLEKTFLLYTIFSVEKTNNIHHPGCETIEVVIISIIL